MCPQGGAETRSERRDAENGGHVLEKTAARGGAEVKGDCFERAAVLGCLMSVVCSITQALSTLFYIHEFVSVSP